MTIVLLWLAGWVGHAYWLTTQLCFFYGLPFRKWFLRRWRLLTGLLILGFPVLAFPVLAFAPTHPIILAYLGFCSILGLLIYPIVTLYRLLRRPPKCVRREYTETVDYQKLLGLTVIGDGRMAKFVRRLPQWLQRHLFRVDFTEWTITHPRLPAEWDGLTIALLSDFHFHGTPSRDFYAAIVDRFNTLPIPDLVVLAGDFLDSDDHRPWIREILGQLQWKEAGLAILGNHDLFHDPQATSQTLHEAGFLLLGGRVLTLSIRGQDCLISGNEQPWIPPAPPLTPLSRTQESTEPFHLCVAHSPDNFYWGIRHGVDLMLCGHVHGGQIRLPIIGSMFVPSIYGRRFDQGVFASQGMVMVVNRGLGGKEPLRFRCNPQVARIILRASS